MGDINHSGLDELLQVNDFQSHLDAKLCIQIRKGLKDYPHRAIVAGIRPENMLNASLPSRGDTATSKPQTVTVDVVEPVGNEVFVYFSEAGQRYCMRMSPEQRHYPGEDMQILIELEKIYFFDIKSDKRYV